jgi:hypothetical protein
LSCSAMTSEAIRSLPLRFELVDKLGHVFTFTPACAWRVAHFENLEPRRDIDAVIGGRLFVDRLLLGFHDVGQRRIARLVEAQIGGHHGRQFDLDGLQAAVDFALDLCRAVAQFQLVGEGRLRPAEQRRQHLAGLVGIVVDRLLAEDDEAGLFRFADGFEDFGHRQRFDIAVGLHQDAAVGAHRERGADGLLRLPAARWKRRSLPSLCLFPSGEPLPRR